MGSDQKRRASISIEHDDLRTEPESIRVVGTIARGLRHRDPRGARYRKTMWLTTASMFGLALLVLAVALVF
jgi:hypothetical protein